MLGGHDYVSAMYGAATKMTGYFREGAHHVRNIYENVTVGAPQNTISEYSGGPEFGPIAAIVLAVSIVGIIVATTRYSKFSFLPKM
jgi:predicted secreted protein with PEFG-CTERM motif